MMFKQSGLIIDKAKNRYKKYVSVLFFEIGDEWISLPKVAFVAVTKVKGAQKFNSARTMGNSSVVKFDMFCVFLCVDMKMKVMVLKTKKIAEALNLATNSAQYLGVELKNYIKEN